MRTMTATQASRHFSELLDAIESGETVTITRGDKPVAEIGPARRSVGAELREVLDGIEPFARFNGVQVLGSVGHYGSVSPGCGSENALRSGDRADGQQGRCRWNSMGMSLACAVASGALASLAHLPKT